MLIVIFGLMNLAIVFLLFCIMTFSLFQQPSFLNQSNIYEVNIRQYTPEGTFNAFVKHLPRLHSMGVHILWLMPVHPIGILKRKGTMGSFYAVKDHTAINPEFGTEEEFTSLIMYAHSLGMKVILDWVANHAAWDHLWTLTNPSFFECHEDGSFKVPFDWDDVIQIDHSNTQQQQAMTNAMQYWISKFNIDGFRADMAHLTPLQFWKNARTVLAPLKKDLIWLAETETAEYSEVFDINYTWKWMHLTEDYYKDKVDFMSLINLLYEYREIYAEDILRMFYTSNHDENSWNATEYEKYGNLAKAFAVFDCTYNSIPLIYSGQELPNKKKLAFFEKDVIEWQADTALQDFYKTLLTLRRHNTAISATGKNNISFLPDGFSKNILAFSIAKNNDSVLVILNLGKYYSEQNYILENTRGNFKNVFTTEENFIYSNLFVQLKSGDFLILEKIE